MIVGITGAICSGKAALVHFLKQTYEFEAVNLLDIFKARLALLRKQSDSEENKDDEVEEGGFCHEYY